MKSRNWQTRTTRRSKQGKSLSFSAAFLFVLAVIAFQHQRLGWVDPIAASSIRSSTLQVKSRRRFVSYQSSPWEVDWLKNIDAWADSKRTICHRLQNEDFERMHNFLNFTCTNYYAPPYEQWCKQEDYVMPMWYNWKERSPDFNWTYAVPDKRMKNMETSTPAQHSQMQEEILSRFTFRDEVIGEDYYEYIEPLVAALRHPLAGCHTGGSRFSLPPIVTRAYIIPPPVRPRANKILYFDAGASSWSEGDGGPSLQYFTKVWSRRGIDFDAIYAYEMNTSPEDFHNSVPAEFKNRTTFRQCAVSSSSQASSKENPFLPHEISKVANPDDYVLFKLDIDSALVEAGSIQYLLENDDVRVDEVAWEHHVYGNPVMRRSWAKNDGEMANMTLRESYDLFLRMRQKGIRAHSWV